ncbi:MAG: NAD(P)H-hydrate epimerase [Rhodoglobus sp.]
MTAKSFRTDAGFVVPAITTVQMREVDRVAVDELGPNLYQMMENAGRHLANRGGNVTLDAELLVDAVLGYSLGGAPHGAAAELIRWMSRHTAPVVSLDIPSGVDSTTGVAPGDHVTATHTMTLAGPKTGLDAEAVGTLWLADIGIPREVYRRVGIELPHALFAPGSRVRLRAS